MGFLEYGFQYFSVFLSVSHSLKFTCWPSSADLNILCRRSPVPLAQVSFNLNNRCCCQMAIASPYIQDGNDKHVQSFVIMVILCILSQCLNRKLFYPNARRRLRLNEEPAWTDQVRTTSLRKLQRFCTCTDPCTNECTCLCLYIYIYVCTYVLYVKSSVCLYFSILLQLLIFCLWQVLSAVCACQPCVLMRVN